VVCPVLFSGCSLASNEYGHPEYSFNNAWIDVGYTNLSRGKPQQYDTIENFTGWQEEIGYQYIVIEKTNDDLFTVRWSPNGNPMSNTSNAALTAVFDQNRYPPGKDGFTVEQLVNIIHKFRVDMSTYTYDGVIYER